MTTGAQLNGSGTYEVDAGQLTINPAVSIVNLNQGGGNLAGSGAITVTGALNWTGGDEYGTGGSGGFGSTTVANSATLSISGSGTKNLRGSRTLTNQSTNAAWTGTGAFQIGESAILANAGTFTVSNSISLVLSTFGSVGVINNTGTWNQNSLDGSVVTR